MSLRLAIAALFLAATTPAAEAQSVQVGFERQVTAEGIEVGIWYPATGTPVHQRLGLYAQDVVPDALVPGGKHPLVVISHGTGGDFAGHVDTAVALARAGFIVAALTHPGDNWRDNSRATLIEGRPIALSAAISYMLQAWPGGAAIDPDRIGAFGFSAGGFTVLAAAGGKPDMTRFADHCAKHPAFFVCTLLRSQPRTLSTAWPPMTDPRIKAIVVAAPAIGFTFDRAGLEKVRIPVQLWRADNDHILPAPFYADAVRAALPIRPDFHAVSGAGHFDFLAPCAEPATMPQLCGSAPDFDRTMFHARFDTEVVRFFAQKLNRPGLAATPDGRRFRPYAACYAIVGSSAEGSPVIGSTWQSVRKDKLEGRPIWRIVVHQRLANGRFDLRDAFALDARTLRPISLTTTRDGKPNAELSYGSDRVTGYKLDRQGNRVAVDQAFTSPVWDGNLFGPTFAAMPLAIGKSFTLPFYQYDRGLGAFTVAVTGTEVVKTPTGRVEAWVIDVGSSVDRRLKYLIAKQDGREIGYSSPQGGQRLGGECAGLE